MDLEFLTEDLSAEDCFEIDENNDDYSTLEGERCGICMDIIIDRGVLDCCQHWFCFTCIDNWATITNLCPLCQNEFQLITCVPVYDTTGSNKIEDDTFSRDDDWCIEGKSNTLSFPSYYIDENAVVCLDGDGCKVRSGSAKIEEVLNLDTSIACDSCDIWYHAFCVGFDTEGTCENSWLCPRCLADEHPLKSDAVPTLGPSNQSGPQNSGSECLVEASYSGKVSISLADAGETAVVVSMVEGNNGTEGPNEKLLKVEVSEDLKLETCDSCPSASISKLEKPSSKMTSIQLNVEAHELELSLSRDSSFKLPLVSLDLNELKKTTKEPSGSRKLFDESRESSVNLQLGLSVGSSLSVDNIKSDVAEDQVPGDLQQNSISEECLLPASKCLPDTKGTVVGITGGKRKHRDYSDLLATEDEDTKARIKTKVLAKRIRAEADSQTTHLIDQADEPVLDSSQKHPIPIAASIDDELGCKSEDENATSDIMSIVQATDRRKSSKQRENASGLRVKKILRRAAEDKESSILVQNLRKEIREAVRNKTSKEFGENLFDPKLLAAFRAAVAGPDTEPPKKLPDLVVKAKKSMLQKGKTRENLTRKIYAIGGRRRKTWTRDCEVEFWKHRCLKTTKPEKIQTLKSVLDLLRKSPEEKEMKPGKKGEATNSILSRLYLADTSVFPRKDDVKPILAINSGNSEENKGHALLEKAASSTQGNDNAKTMQTNNFLSQFSIGHPTKIPAGPSVSLVGGSKGNLQKEKMTGKSVDIKTDKRKWALEVLARKTAVTGGNAGQEKQEDVAVLKGSYPLLVQLPADMRPVLAQCRHNKIPISVRQAQLYRLTEHFLRKTNLPVIRRTADTELAVADAVNIEKEIANRSNSKLVYVNLCSQELLHRSDHIKTLSVTETNSSPTSEIPTTSSEQATDDLSTGPVVEEALRNAGLLSDSPPNSPNDPMEVTNDEDDPSKKNGEEGPDNIFEMDSHPELDIYGDFEYDLEDEDYIGASALKLSKQQPEEESQIKLLFSTLSSDVSNNALDKEDHSRSLTLEGGPDGCIPQYPLLGEGSEELSLAECEELYGPDKEPLIKRFPEIASIKPCEAKADDNAKASGLERESCAETLVEVGLRSSGGEESLNHSQTSENPAKKEKIPSRNTKKQSDSCNSVFKKVEAYIKEHIRPLCKSGVINVEQYRWAVGKTTEKVMKYHSKEKNANFLIKEGEKVKKLAEKYVESAQQMKKS